ncbi:fumarylacetoacetate hydrolase family protein [Parafrigoribacterium mesophilum]|uniref:fumarylacetoacetate hydrolase family protein n=1 Tax=Parafrigoribacterium mesophilum TaxID=433646 RepID=UPI0031FC33CE
MFSEQLDYTGESFAEDVVFLPPVRPAVVLGMAHNGSASDRQLAPGAFFKSARTVCGPHDGIVLDRNIGSVNVEGELAVVIARQTRHLAPGQSPRHILGYTIANDVTSIDQISFGGTLLQAKNGDGYTPLGPWIETAADPASLAITLRIQGVTVARSTTSGLAWSIDEQLVYLSSHLELGPGDVVLTGAPGTSAAVLPGDDVEIVIEGIGSLRNPVVRGRARAAAPSP